MTSNFKPEEPPLLIQKGIPHRADETDDQSLFTAFKRLKMDADGSCVGKKEDESKVVLKHKPEAEQKRPVHLDASKDDWSGAFQNFCFCDEEALNKKSRSRWRSMCRYHRLRARKGSANSGSKSCLNLVQAWRAHKPLLQEVRLKLAEKQEPTQLIHSARFSFKPVRPTDAKNKPVFASKSVSFADVITIKKPFEASGSKASSISSKKQSANTETAAPVFAAAASENMFTFSSMLSELKDMPSCAKEQVTVSNMQGYRSGAGQSRHLPLWPSTAARQSSSAHCHSSGNLGSVAAPRIDLALERSCSQEARLDESEFSVTELAAYFDNFLYLPKEMSSMAQMMYT